MIPDRINEALWRIEALEAELEAERALADQLGNKLTIATLYINDIDALSEIQVALNTWAARRSPKGPT